MVEHSEFTSVVHETVSSAKEHAEKLQNKIHEDSFAGEIRLSTLEAQKIATLLRINANLVANLTEENSRIHDQLQSLINRINK